jgi:antitoxin (DNA-binding transcriptional repressor) of toxin-antitoxin stability system
MAAELTRSTYEAKAQLSKLLDLVSLGCEIVITRNRIPIGRLVGMAAVPKQQQESTETHV